MTEKVIDREWAIRFIKAAEKDNPYKDKFDGTLAMKGSNWQCKYCEYKEECKILEESKKKRRCKNG